MNIIYLDHNCYQRGFDDQTQIRIKLEALACQVIFVKAKQNKLLLVWSFMNEDETRMCLFSERNYEILRLSELCKIRIGPEEEIIEYAKEYQKKCSLSAKDSLHLACSCFSNAKYLLTCDDNFIKKANKLHLEIRVINPLDYIREEKT